MKTPPELTLVPCRSSTYLSPGSLVRQFLALADTRSFEANAALSSLLLPDWLERKDLRIFFLRPFLDCFRLTEDGLLFPLNSLCGLRYNLELQVLNSAAFGVAQSRKRVYIIGYFGSGCAGQVLPFIGADRAPLVQTIRPAGFTPLLIKEATRRGYKKAYPGDSVDIGYVDNNTRRGRVGRGIAHTLNASRMQGVLMPDGRIRRLIPRECFRLQGFSDLQIDKLLANVSNPHAYVLAGNATTVNVVYALAKHLKTAHEAAVAATGAEEEQAAA